MNSDKFLSAVADYYVRASLEGKIDLSEVCLVFPNKRAAIFFRRYFKQCAKEITFIPDINTIGAFNERFCDKQVADRIQLQFILYKAYCKVMKDRSLNAMQFDRFAFWGNMILSDFDDIDKSMADAHKLFANIERYKEISSNFLTPEQLDVVRSIWGEETAANMQVDSERFWKHIKYSDDPIEEKPSTKFIKLWQILDPLYTEFNRLLEVENLAYPGLVSREIAETVKSDGLDNMPFRRVGFVGFNMVSISQAKMMQTLQARGLADFFWDLLPDMSYAERAGHRTKELNQAFPMPADYVQPVYNISECKINVYGVPSNTLQAKAAGNILECWKPFINTEVPDNTVVVLPEPALLSPMLNAIPDNLGIVNITMGLSYRDTPFATLLRTIVMMHRRCRYVNNQPFYFYEDISAIIANPNMRAIAFDSCLAIKGHLDKYHQYLVHADKLKDIIRKSMHVVTDRELSREEMQQNFGGEVLIHVFDDVPDQFNVEQTRIYLDTLIEALNNALEFSAEKVNRNAHEIKVIDAYKKAIDHVFDCINKYRISSLGQYSIFAMLDRLLAVHTLNMSGTPLSGLQIMGVLETRAVDFENVVIMSMNERVYPRRNRQHSLIPQLLRHAFALNTTASAEQEYSYYFFRLFSRAKRVVCLYDSRATGAGNGAMSRYLLQFKYLYPTAHINFDTCSTYAKQTEPRTIMVAKDATVIKELKALTPYSEERINLSATALKMYRKCPLAFYFEYVKRVREEDTPTAFMDSATYGSVMHGVLQDLFNDQGENAVITEDVLKMMIHSRAEILQRVRRKINELYHHYTYKQLDKMPAESIVLSEIMADFIIQVIEKEILFVQANKPFIFKKAEEKIEEPWQVSAKSTVNFRFDIDRHDVLNNGEHRFVDYKTGKDDVKVSSIEGLFSQNSIEANDAALQLLIYSAAYSDLHKANYPIRPSLNRLRTVFTEKENINNDSLKLHVARGVYEDLVWQNTANPNDVPDWQKEFRQELEDMIDSIFDETVPFEQTSEIENCRYCNFLQLCSREVPEKQF